MEYLVSHRTTYRYLQDVSHSWHLAHLQPRATPLQAVHDSSISLSLEPASRVAREDYFQNPCEWFSIDQPHTHLEVLAQSRVTVQPAPQRASRDSLPWEEVQLKLENPLEEEERDAVQYLFDSPMTKFHSDIAAYGIVSFPPSRPVLAGAIELMNRIHQDFRYDTTVTDVTTPVDRVFEIRAGVCQDLAHVGIAAMRAVGLPARYVSGYLLTDPPEGQPRLLGVDASHAWVAAYSPNHGWVEFDPTNDTLADRRYITLATGADFADVVPFAASSSAGEARR